jgi:hypothetical protein
MATLGTTSKPAYVYDTETDTWVPIGVGAHTHALTSADVSGVVAQSGYFAAGKNKIINGDFGIWQRGTTLALNSSYTYLADRFKTTGRNGSGTQSQHSLTVADSALCANLKYAYKLTMTSAATNVTPTISQVVEDSFPYYGRTMTLSFYAKASKAITLQTRPDLLWANADNYTTAVNHSLTTIFQRFTHTFTITPSGSYNASTDYGLFLPFYAPMNDTYDIYITGVQLEAGSTATAFETATGNPASELAACQRYYWRAGGDAAYNGIGIGSSVTTTSSVIWVPNPVTMRAIPSSVDYSTLAITDYQNYGVSVSSLSLDNASRNGCFVNTGHAASVSQYRMAYLRTNNSTSGYFGVSAEL